MDTNTPEFTERRWMDLTGAAGYLSVRERTIRVAVWRKELRRAHLGKKFIFDRLDLDRWAESRKAFEN